MIAAVIASEENTTSSLEFVVGVAVGGNFHRLRFTRQQREHRHRQGAFNCPGGLEKQVKDVETIITGKNWIVGCFRVPVMLGLLFLSSLTDTSAASLPKSTEDMLKKLKLNASILADLDKELEVPNDWMEKARKEGKLRVVATWEMHEAKVLLAPFQERYPFIQVEYLHRSTQESRTTQTLIAYKSGRIITDVLTSLGGTLDQFEEARALEDLRGIRGLENLPDAARDPNTLTVGKEVNYWCMGYNTRLAKKESLPKRWEDLPATQELGGGNLALANRPQLWVIQLWKAKGEEWTKNFITRLFTDLKPQTRKEGLNAIPQLLAAGEFHAAIPSSQSHIRQLTDVGAPVGYHCPEPVTAAMSDSSILRGAPNLHAAKIFVNWLLSKEGQIAQLISTQSVPIHKGLQRPEFIPFADKILGKPIIFRDTKSEREHGPAMTKFWSGLWLRSGAK